MDWHPWCLQEKGAKLPEAEPKERDRSQVLVMLQTVPKVTVPGFVITGANYLLLVLEPLWTGLSFLQCRIPTNAEFPPCVVSCLPIAWQAP